MNDSRTEFPSLIIIKKVMELSRNNSKKTISRTLAIKSIKTSRNKRGKEIRIRKGRKEGRKEERKEKKKEG